MNPVARHMFINNNFDASLFKAMGLPAKPTDEEVEKRVCEIFGYKSIYEYNPMDESLGIVWLPVLAENIFSIN